MITTVMLIRDITSLGAILTLIVIGTLASPLIGTRASNSLFKLING